MEENENVLNFYKNN